MSLRIARHFVLLALAALPQVTLLPHRGWAAGLCLALDLQGTLHALALVGALAGPRALPRRALFVPATALLAAAAFYAGLFIDGRLDRVWHLGLWADIDRAVVIVAALGGTAYAFLVRLFWLPRLGRLACVQIGLACALVVGIAGATRIPEDWRIVLWWFTFSAGIAWFGRDGPVADDALSKPRA